MFLLKIITFLQWGLGRIRYRLRQKPTSVKPPDPERTTLASCDADQACELGRLVDLLRSACSVRQNLTGHEDPFQTRVSEGHGPSLGSTCLEELNPEGANSPQILRWALELAT